MVNCNKECFNTDLEKTNEFVLPVKTPALALFGPSGSGKNTLIQHLLKTGKYVQVPIVTTRAARGNESDRKIVSPEIFKIALQKGKIVYASEHYGHWHGVEKDTFEELAYCGKRLILDPNQFPRLEMLRRIFVHGDLNVVAIIPDTIEGIKMMSDEDIERIYRPRIESRSGVSLEEVQLRVHEAIETLRLYCDRYDEFDFSFINKPGQDPAEHFCDFDMLVEKAFKDDSEKLERSADFPPEIREVLRFFNECDFNYAIFAGFAAHLLVDVTTSLDVDVLLESKDLCLKIADIFENEYGWILIKEHKGPHDRFNLVLEKNGSQLDLVFSPHAAYCFLKQNYIVTKSSCDSEVKVLGPEAMLLTKIAQITSPERSLEKMSRDSFVINKLRSMIDTDKLRNLLGTLGQEYWTGGIY